MRVRNEKDIMTICECLLQEVGTYPRPTTFQRPGESEGSGYLLVICCPLYSGYLLFNDLTQSTFYYAQNFVVRNVGGAQQR